MMTFPKIPLNETVLLIDVNGNCLGLMRFDAAIQRALRMECSLVLVDKKKPEDQRVVKMVLADLPEDLGLTNQPPAPAPKPKKPGGMSAQDAIEYLTAEVAEMREHNLYEHSNPCSTLVPAIETAMAALEREIKKEQAHADEVQMVREHCKKSGISDPFTPPQHDMRSMSPLGE